MTRSAIRSMSLACFFAGALWPQTPIENARTQVARNIALSAQARARAAVQMGGVSLATPFAASVDPAILAGQVATYIGTIVVKGPTIVNLTTPDRKQAYAVLADLVESRTDKQVGAADTAKGTTSAALKGVAPDILGFAVEHGALTREVSGNTVTFRGTPVGIAKALQAKGLLSIYHDYENDPESRFWRRFSFAINMNADSGQTAGGQAAAPATTPPAQKQQVASWSVRAELVNQRDPKLRRYASAFEDLANKSGPYQQAREELMDRLEAWDEMAKWSTDLQAAVKPLDDTWRKDQAQLALLLPVFEERVLQALQDLEGRIQTLPSAAGVVKALDAYASAIAPLLQGRAAVLANVNKGTLITADWTTTRDPQLPDLYALTGILEFAPFGGSDLTLNTGWNFYRVTPLARKRFRDFKLTGQYDRPLGRFGDFGTFVFSLAGRYEHIPNDTVAPAAAAVRAMLADVSARRSSENVRPFAEGDAGGVATAPKGNLALLQAKLTIPVKGSGIKIPLSFTVANRTELIKEKEVRVNFGFTFDFDSFVANLGKR